MCFEAAVLTIFHLHSRYYSKGLVTLTYEGNLFMLRPIDIENWQVPLEYSFFMFKSILKVSLMLVPLCGKH